MKKLFGKIALPLLLAVVLCIQPVSATPDSENDTDNDLIQTTEAQVSLSEFEMLLENGGYSLALDNATGNVAITNKNTGTVHFANPVNSDDSSSLIKSQLTVQYYANDALVSMNTYSDAIQNDSMTYSVNGDVLSVNYVLGDSSFNPDIIPTVLTKERMESFVSKLSKEDSGEVLKYFTLYSKDTLPEEALKGLRLLYPSIDDKDIYVRGSVAAYKAEALYALFVKAGYTEEDLQKDYDENGLENPYEPSVYFDVTMDYQLSNDGFSVTVDPEKIKYLEDYVPVRIDILPYFCAADSSANGFMLVPDGSGSIININNNKYTVHTYEKRLFELDGAMQPSELISEYRESVLPVYALSASNGGFLATIDSGYEEAGVAASVSGQNDSYNNVYGFFDLVSHGNISYGVSGGSNVLAMSKELLSCDLKISYHLFDEAKTYSQLAVMYREILQTKGLLTKEPAIDNIDINVKLIGSCYVNRRFLGIPYTTIDSMTDYKQAAEILAELEGLSAEVNYTNAFGGGILQKSLINFKTLSVLGSKKDKVALEKECERLTFSYYAERAAKVKNSHSTKKLDRSNARYYNYNIVSRQTTKSNSLKILSPSKLASYAGKAVKSLNSNKIESVNIIDIATQLNSDFNVDNQIDRYESRIMVQEYLSKLSEKKRVSVTTGSVYSFNYADKITEIPVTHTGYKIEDMAVPFYQIVISGLIPYSSASVNCADESADHFLKSVEYGAQLQYTWYYEKPDNSSLSEEDYYGMSYATSIEQAVEYAKKYKPLYEKIAGKAIVDHIYISDTLSKTVYENEITVYVNYSDAEVNTNGTTVKAKDFTVIGGWENEKTK